jgi:hypothetical protein
MRARSTLFSMFLSFVAVCVLVPSQGALAWSNGANGPNTFGTHDWILREAIEASGNAGNWICRRAALRATDDPDTVDGIDHASGTWWHAYDEWGSTWGGAPEAVQVWFGRAKARLANGNQCGASRALGIMAHFVGDVAKPMHTDGSLDIEDSVHASYERAVDARCPASSCRYRMTFNGRDPVNAYDRAVGLARGAYQFYAELIRRYHNAGYTSRVDQITRRQLNRAANSVADLIVATG